MRKTEITLTGRRLTIHQEAEERLTAEQKYHIIMTLVGCVTACFIVSAFFSVFR